MNLKVDYVYRFADRTPTEAQRKGERQVILDSKDRESFRRPNVRRMGVVIKRGIDIAFSALALLVLAPLILLIAGIVAVANGRPVLFKHRRVGRYGLPFLCLKFRTMVPDADAVLDAYLRSNPGARLEWQQNQKLVHDPRVTALGRFLRATSLDELPQLINVLRGEMSLVGPRPIVASEIARYGEQFEHCFSVPPGITGIWQVSGRNDCTYAERVELDAKYAREWSLAADMAILARTIPAVLSGRGSR